MLLGKAEMKQLVKDIKLIKYMNKKRIKKQLKIIILYSSEKQKKKGIIIQQKEMNKKDKTLAKKFHIT
jgi:hypothetical protein